MTPKYRVWDTLGKHMFYANDCLKYHPAVEEDKDYSEFLIDGLGQVHWHYYGTYEEAIHDFGDRFILMQSTGLKDKNKIEMYAGDIVLWNPTDHQSWVGEIKLQNECGPCKGLNTFQYTIGDTWNIWNESDLNKMQVKGNIYEHPDLIKQTKKSEYKRTKDLPANAVFKNLANFLGESLEKCLKDTL